MGYTITLEELRRRFTYHAPNATERAGRDQKDRYQEIRERAYEFAEVLLELCPNPSRELSQALTDLEDCVMHANKAIAINESE